MNIDELKKQAQDANDEPEKAGCYAQLGIGAQGDYDQGIREILESGLSSQHEEIRTSATLSIFLLKWPEFKDALEAAIVAEANMDLSAKMAHALAFCVTGGVGKGKTDEDMPA